MSRPSATPVTLLYDGWQVWDGQFGRVRVGGDLVASIEFVQRSGLTVVDASSPPRLEQLGENRYRATAHVLDTAGAVVLDLGALKALRWVRPGESPGDFETGATASLDLSLSINGWPDTPWTNRAAELYGTDHRWHVQRIARMTIDGAEAVEIDAADTDTVDSSSQYCLLECTLLD